MQTLLMLSFIILWGYILFYLLKVGLLPSHSNSYYALKEYGLEWLFSVTLATSSFLLMIVALVYTPTEIKFTAFLMSVPVIFVAIAANYSGDTLESKLHFRSAKIAGIISFIWAILMCIYISWWLAVPILFSAFIFFILNLIWKSKILFLEYWLFSYPYLILYLVSRFFI